VPDDAFRLVELEALARHGQRLGRWSERKVDTDIFNGALTALEEMTLQEPVIEPAPSTDPEPQPEPTTPTGEPTTTLDAPSERARDANDGSHGRTMGSGE